MNKKILGLFLALGLPLLTLFVLPHAVEAIPCPGVEQEWSDQCSNDPEPTGPVIEELGTTKTVVAGLSSDGRNGVTEQLFLFVFPGNAGQVYQIDATLLRNDDPSPGVEFCVNSTSEWGQGYCPLPYQNLDGAPTLYPQSYPVISADNDYTYYSHLVVRLKVRQTFGNDNDVQAQFIMHRREFNGWQVNPTDGEPQVADSSITVGEAPVFTWNSEGYASRSVMFAPDDVFYSDLDDDSSGFTAAVQPTAGTKEFSIQFSGPARYGGEVAVQKDLTVIVSEDGGGGGDVEGCTDDEAENYNPAATIDDGSCTYSDNEVHGCTDPTATNYNPAATVDNDSCVYTTPTPEPDGIIKVRSSHSTSWVVSGPETFSGSGATNGSGYSAAPGSYSITASDKVCYSKSITPSATQSVLASSEITFTITYELISGCGETPPEVPPNSVPASCTGSAAQDTTTTALSGSFLLFAYGVENASSVVFPTWSNTGGQDDIVWYPGTFIGDGTWRATVDLANHRSGNPDYGAFNSHVYMSNSNHPNVFCGTANFTRNQADQVPTGTLATASCSVITGSASDPDTPSDSIGVHIYRDGLAGSGGTFLTSTVASGASHSFSVATPALTGAHTIYAYGINSNPSGTHSLLTNSPISIDCGEEPPPPPPEAVPVPTNLSATCPVPGSTATLTWTLPTGYTLSYVRVQNTTTGVFVGSVPESWPDAEGGSPHHFSVESTPSHSYTWWVHTRTADPLVYSSAVYGSFTCGGTVPPPPVTAQLDINVITGSGFTGTGTVSGLGISCPGDCTEIYAYGSQITLTATPASGSIFSTWSSNCSPDSTPSCMVTMTQDRGVAVGFVSSFDYSLSNSGTVTVNKSSGNAFGQNTITKTFVSGSAGPVYLTVSALPAGVSRSIANSSCTPTCTSVITFTVAPTTVAGTYSVTVTGTPLSKTTQFNLVINPPTFPVSCEVDIETALLGQEVTFTGEVSGGTEPYTYAWSGTGIPTSPAPSTNPYVKAFTTTGTKEVQLTVTDAVGSQATCPAVAVEVTFDPNFEEF